MANAWGALCQCLSNAVHRLAVIETTNRDEIHATANTLKDLHLQQLKTLYDFATHHEVLAATGTSWTKWLNESLEQAQTAKYDADGDPINSITAIENAILTATDDLFAHILRDPLRAEIERLRAETYEALRRYDITLQANDH